MSDHIENRREVESISDAEKFWSAVERTMLKPKERAVLILKCVEDLTHYEIADRIHVSEKTSQRLFRRAIKKLRDTL